VGVVVDLVPRISYNKVGDTAFVDVDNGTCRVASFCVLDTDVGPSAESLDRLDRSIPIPEVPIPESETGVLGVQLVIEYDFCDNIPG
jgi:hypothetical protein